jgi:hypothetical protein
MGNEGGQAFWMCGDGRESLRRQDERLRAKGKDMIGLIRR